MRVTQLQQDVGTRRELWGGSIPVLTRFISSLNLDFKMG